MWVMLLWVATSHCYDIDVYFNTGGTENYQLYISSLTNPDIFLHTIAEEIIMINFAAYYLWVSPLFIAAFELKIMLSCAMRHALALDGWASY